MNRNNNISQPVALLVAASVGAGSLSGCEAIGQNDDSRRVVQGGVESRTDAVASQFSIDGTVYTMAFDDYIDKEEWGRMQDMRGKTSGAASRLLGATTARYLIDSVRQYTTSDEIESAQDVKDAMTGLDADISQKTLSAWTLKNVDNEVQRVQLGSISYEDFQKTLADKGINNLDPKVSIAVQQSIGADKIDDINEWTNPDRADESLEGITDPTVRKLYDKKKSVFIADDIIDKLSALYTTKEGATNELEGIIDPKIKTLATAALQSFDYGTIDEWYKKYSNSLADAQEGVDTEVAELAKKAEAVYKKAVDISKINDEIDKTKLEAAGSLDIEISKRIKEFNKNLRPKQLTAIDKLKDPNAALRLEEASGDKKVTVNEGGVETVYDQLGEIYFDGEKTSLVFDADADIDGETRQHIEEAVEANRPLIEAAQAQGTLLTVRLLINPEGYATDYDYSPHYDGMAREVRMIVPKNNSVSVDMFRSGLTHELIHALVADAYYGLDKVSDKEIEKMASACNAISMQAYTEFSVRMKYSTQQLDALIAIAGKEDQKLLKNMRKLIQTDKLDDVLAKNMHNNKYAYSLDTACESANFFNIVALSALNDDANASEVISGFYDRLGETKEFDEVYAVWDDALKFYGLNKKLNESSYVITDSDVKKYLGHTEDNGNELMASTVDAVLNYPAQMNQVYKDLPKEDRVGMRLAVETSIGLLTKRFPTLKGYLLKAKSKVLSLS
jgi:hypothetical protein